MKKNALGMVLIALVAAQFIITIDTTFMNVSISTLVVDLNTTVTGVQSAITLYALVMAAFMIAGAKFGDIVGRRKAFLLGLLVYGAGTTITSLSPNLTIFILGWSVLEGLGASLMLPAMMSLIADNFKKGPERTKAYTAFAASAGIAAAIGPVIGGLFTTYLSWRLAFASELLVVLFILTQRHRLVEQKLKGEKPKFDWLGFGLSASGLIILVEGIILGSTYGLLKARQPFVVFGKTLIQTGGISPTVFFVLIGIAILFIFYLVESSRAAWKKSTLLNTKLFEIKPVSRGGVIMMMQAFVITGVIFSISLYTQMQLGYNAIKSGITLLPLSVGVLAVSFLASKIFAKKYSPRGLMSAGFILVILGVLAMGLTARNATSGYQFLIGLALIGSGIALIVSQNQNLMISSVKPEQTNETSGTANTFQNVGSSLGTSIAGAVIIAIFISLSTSAVSSSSAFTSSQQQQINQKITQSAQIVSNQQLTATTSGLPPEQQQALIQINASARQESLTIVYFVIGTVATIGLIAALLEPKTSPLGEIKVTA